MSDQWNVGSNDKTSPAKCFFCGNEFDGGLLQDHLLQCGSILEQCSRRCGAWIQRKHKDSHSKECPKVQEAKIVQTSSTFKAMPIVAETVWKPPSLSHTDIMSILEKEFKHLNTRSNQEMQDRKQIFEQLDYLKTQYLESEKRNQQLLTTIIGLRRNLEEEAIRKVDMATRIEQDINSLHSKHQEIEQFKDEIVSRLDAICSSILHEQSEREQLELILNNQDKKNELVYAIETEVNLLRNILSHEQLSRQQQIAEIQEQLLDIRNKLADHRPVSRDLLEDHLQNMKLLHEDVELKLRGTSDLIMRHQLLDVELKQARTTIEEDKATIQALQKDLKALSKSYTRLRNEFNEHRKEYSFKDVGATIENTSGHLIWRIEDYGTKMKEAIENDTILYSKLFRASMYGYTLQMELNLNGIGKWRSRCLTATVNVVPGDYDPLLEWPCDLTVDIILRDQAAKRSEAMNIVKSLSIRKKSSSKKADYDEVYNPSPTGKSEDGSLKINEQKPITNTVKRQYIFIPHTSLDKFDYIKNNVIFFEVVISH